MEVECLGQYISHMYNKIVLLAVCFSLVKTGHRCISLQTARAYIHVKFVFQRHELVPYRTHAIRTQHHTAEITPRKKRQNPSPSSESNTLIRYKYSTSGTAYQNYVHVQRVDCYDIYVISELILGSIFCISSAAIYFHFMCNENWLKSTNACSKQLCSQLIIFFRNCLHLSGPSYGFQRLQALLKLVPPPYKNSCMHTWAPARNI